MFSVLSPAIDTYPVRQKSLRADLRKKEFDRISKENYELLKRLKDKKASISTKKLIKESEKHDLILKNLANNRMANNLVTTQLLTFFRQGFHRVKEILEGSTLTKC